MRKNYGLGYFLEDLWAKGFKLSDEHIRFIYFGKNSTNASEWKTIIAVKTTLKFQQQFDPSFFISVLEHITKKEIRSKRQAYASLEAKGLSANRLIK
ncbi:hypothetical protein EQV77_03200 [Halobacillus fulvus]|nr:hypothetical protein EQV77_03200 [Halobacillus fulvus]